MPYAREYDFKKEFEKDVRSKKRISSNVHKQKGKRGYVGKMLTTVDLLKGKEKREYTKSGKVVKWNMYKQLIPMEELQEYTPDQQKQIVEKWREVHSTKEITKALGVKTGKYYYYLYKIGVLEEPEKDPDKKKKRRKYAASRLPVATEYDILSSQELARLPMPERYYTLNYYYTTYSKQSIADVWGTKLDAVHNRKYNYTRQMKEAGYSMEPPADFKLPEPKKKAEKVEEEEKAVAVAPETEKLTLFVDGKPEEKQEEKEDATIQTSSSHSLFKDIEKYEVNPDPVKEDKSAAEIEAIKVLQRDLEDQKKRMDQFMKDQQQAFREERSEGHEKKSGMSFSFEDEKEGFLLHEDIQRFISVLKKNPDDFKVSVSIQRVD